MKTIGKKGRRFVRRGQRQAEKLRQSIGKEGIRRTEPMKAIKTARKITRKAKGKRAVKRTEAVLRKAMKNYKRVKKTSKLGSGKRFSAMTKALKARGAKNPGALAAYIGKKRYGAKRMAKMAAAGRKRK